jgi:hypothetical protein
MDQGAAGDCYLISALGAIANTNPTAITNMFIDNGDSTWTVRFYYSPSGLSNGPYTADYVTVDKQLPTYNGWLIYDECGLSYDHPALRAYNDATNELWIALVEKAYAQWNETGRALRPTSPTNLNGSNTYASLDSGLGEVLAQVLGQSAHPYLVGVDGTESILKSALDAHKAVIIGTNAFGTESKDGLMATHAYVVTAYNNHTFTLYNPWGINGTNLPMSLQIDWTTLAADCNNFSISNTAWDGRWDEILSARRVTLSTAATDHLFGDHALLDADLLLDAKFGIPLLGSPATAA